jgi:hypothetical protein
MAEIRRIDFALAEGFEQGSPAGGLGLGVLEAQYEELFAEVLEDGIITEEERERLEKAAENLGLDRGRLARLEDAMTAAYETHHRVRVVDIAAKKASSVGPLASPPPRSVPALQSLEPGDPGEVQRLRAEVNRLQARVAELSQELERAQAALNVEVNLSEIEALATSARSPEEAWKQVRRDPHDPSAYRALYEAYDAAGQLDGKVLVAQALVGLGAATAQEAQLAAQGEQVGLMAPARSIDASLWQSCLIHPEQEAVVGAIFGVIAPAVLIGRVTTLRRDGQLRPLSPDKRQDPATTTLMAVRALPWGAAILGLAAPAIFVEKDQETGYEHRPGVPPLTIVGRGALSGRSASELAFMAGRHLSGYRAEHFVLGLFGGTEDLEDLFLAALVIANPQLPLRAAHRARIEPLARAIEPLLEPPQHDALRGHYLRFTEEGGRASLHRWRVAVERTAARVGLSLAQNPSAALAILAEEEGHLGPLALDLLTFATSDRFLRLRRALGVAQAPT